LAQPLNSQQLLFARWCQRLYLSMPRLLQTEVLVWKEFVFQRFQSKIFKYTF
jgi:hypothetical protein